MGILHPLLELAGGLGLPQEDTQTRGPGVKPGHHPCENCGFPLSAGYAAESTYAQETTPRAGKLWDAAHIPCSPTPCSAGPTSDPTGRAVGLRAGLRPSACLSLFLMLQPTTHRGCRPGQHALHFCGGGGEEAD